MAAADYRLLTEATGQRIATALESLVNLGDPVTVSHGGSGLSASPSMLVNLASTAAENVMQSDPRPGVTGALPIANGGTGGTTKADALLNLGASVYLDTASWADVYEKFSAIPNGRNANFAAASGTVSSFISGKTFSYRLAGTVFRNPAASGMYDVYCSGDAGAITYAWRITGLTSASATPTIGTVYKYTGTAM